MEIRQLKYFVCIAEMRSVSRAAVSLNVPQPMLSRHIQRLESEYNEVLFLRNGRGVETTAAGEQLLSHARGILRLAERAGEDLKNFKTGKSARVAIGMLPSYSDVIAIPLVERMRKELPEVFLTLTHGRSPQLQEALLSGGLDMALLMDSAPTPMLETHFITRDRLALIGSDHFLAETPEEVPISYLTRYPLILSSRPNRLRMMLDSAMALIGETPHIIMESDSPDLAYKLARSSVACTVRFARNAAGEHGLISCPIIGAELSMQSEIALPSRRPKSGVHDTVLSIFLDISRKMLR